MKTEGEVRAELAETRSSSVPAAGAPGGWSAEAAKRPDGTALRIAGQILILIGVVIGSVAAFSSDVTGSSYSAMGVTPTYNAWKWPAIWLSAAAVQFGVLLALVGVIVRALYFLPGRDVANGEFMS